MTRDAVLRAVITGRRTVREIAPAVGLRSNSTVWYHLDRLEDAGLLERPKLDGSPYRVERAAAATPWGVAVEGWQRLLRGEVS